MLSLMCLVFRSHVTLKLTIAPLISSSVTIWILQSPTDAHGGEHPWPSLGGPYQRPMSLRLVGLVSYPHPALRMLLLQAGVVLLLLLQAGVVLCPCPDLSMTQLVALLRPLRPPWTLSNHGLPQMGMVPHPQQVLLSRAGVVSCPHLGPQRLLRYLLQRLQHIYHLL